MKFVNKHKALIIIGVILLACLFLGISALKMFNADEKQAIYGHRLKGIEKVNVDKKTFSKLKDGFKEDAVSNIETRVSGRTIEIIITVNDDVPVETAKIYGNKTLEFFSEDQKGYYDIQVFAKKDSDAKDFPIIGYKHKSKEGMSWTKDRGNE